MARNKVIRGYAFPVPLLHGRCDKRPGLVRVVGEIGNDEWGYARFVG